MKIGEIIFLLVEHAHRHPTHTALPMLTRRASWNGFPDEIDRTVSLYAP
ncbi:MAG: hypothetical protein PHF57_05750 [Methanoregula sp.]|jgi:hypothetical protein|nr:hypothetical protein [Methanoregula sp.]